MKICVADDLQAFNGYFSHDLSADRADGVFSDKILQAILLSKNIFNYLLTEHIRDNEIRYFYAHQLLYPLLNFALLYPAVYERQICEILNFGIKHNLDIATRLSCDSIMQNGDLMQNDRLIGRAVVYNAAEAINGNEKLFIKLNDLNSSIKAIETKQLNLNGGYSGLSVRYIDGVIEKERTYNECEYAFLKLMETSGYSKTPKYLGIKNGKDIFGYIKGETIPYTYEMNEKAIVAITQELKIINGISKQHLNGQVYVHGDLGAQNVVFDNGEIVGIIDWDNTFIGEEYDDFIYVFWTWANVGNLQRNDDKMFDLLRAMIDTYNPDEIFKSNFANKIMRRMERKLENTPIRAKTYNRIYEWVKWSEEWVKKYKDKISATIG
ncbi:MAG: phosphotransferase [Clostridia bacterium]|nr:phosphotransferase [Clostridia bacterium]